MDQPNHPMQNTKQTPVSGSPIASYEFPAFFADHFSVSDLAFFSEKLDWRFEIPDMMGAWAEVSFGLHWGGYQSLAGIASPILREGILARRVEKAFLGERMFASWFELAFDEFCSSDGLDAPYVPPPSHVYFSNAPSLQSVSSGFEDRIYVKRLTERIFANVLSSVPQRASPRRKKKFQSPVEPFTLDLSQVYDNIDVWEQCVVQAREKREMAAKPMVQYNSHYADRMKFGLLRRKLRRLLREPKVEKAAVKPLVSAFQSGKTAHLVVREMREEELRAKAKAKAEAERKKVPKQERLAAIKQHRDKRNPVFQSRLRPSVIGSSAITPRPRTTFRIVCASRDVRFQGGVPVALGAVAAFGIVRALGDIVKAVRKIGSAAEASEGLAGELKTKIQNIGRDFKKHLGPALWKVPLVMVAFYAMHRLIIQAPAVPLIISAVLTPIVGPMLWKHCSKYFEDKTVVLQSGLTGPSDFSSLCSKLFATVFTFSAFAGRKSTCVMEFMKRVALVERFSGGLATFGDWFISALQFGLNTIRSMFGKEKISLMKEQHQPLVNWMREVDEIIKKDVTEGAITPDELSLMVDVIRRGYEFKEVYRGSRLSKMVEDHLSKIAAAIVPYQGALQARNNFRFEPSMLMLYGDPGVGKTMMAMPFCASVLKMSGILPADASFEKTVAQIWQKGNSEFWNGYAGQECLVMDDCFQAKADKTDKENDPMTIIRMVSSWSFPLNFADLASKGKIYFGSKFIFGTTNLASIDSEARVVIQEPEAVLRRMGYSYKLRVHPDFALPDGKLNYRAFECAAYDANQHGHGIDAYPWKVWEVCKHDYSRGVSDGCWIPVRELLTQIAENLRYKMLNHDEQKLCLRGYIDKLSQDSPVVEAVDPHPPGVPLSTNPEDIVNFLASEIEFQGLGWPRTIQQHSMLSYHNGIAHLGMVREEMDAELDDREQCGRLLAGIVGFFKVFAIAYIATAVLQKLIELLLGVIGKLFGGYRKDAVQQSNVPTGGGPRKGVSPKHVKLQGHDDAIATNVYANSYKLYVKLETGSGMVIGQVQLLVGQLAAQPVHFTRDIARMLTEGSLAEGQCMTFRNCMQPQCQFTMSAEEYLGLRRVTHEISEVEFVEFKHIRAHRNIISNYIKEADYTHLGGHPVRLDVCNITPRGAIGSETSRKVFVSNHLACGRKLRVQGHTVDRYFQYQAATEAGDCGAPLCALNPTRFSGRVCFGMHIAGTNDKAYGYSSVITQEIIADSVKRLAVIEDEFEDDMQARGNEFHSSNELPFEEQGSFLPICKVTKAVSICPKSSYFKTPEFGVVGEYVDSPAPLGPVKKDDKWVFPMCNAVKPYSSPALLYEQKWLKQAVYIATRPLHALINYRDRSVYTFEQAVIGIPTEKFRSMPRNTAAGYPYVLSTRNGKKEFFGDGEEYDLTLPKCVELRKRVNHIIEKAREGKRLSHVFLDFLKDELRSPEKVDAVATRLISSAPVDYSLAFRMYFGAFSAAAMSVPVKCGMAPGINCFGDWDELGTKMQSMGDSVFDGDFKAFDSSEQACIHDLVLDIVNDWYCDGEENQRIRKVLWLELTHSRHIGGTGFDQCHIYQWNHSLPSGHPFTTIINSIYSLVLLVGSYIKRTGDWSGFWENATAVTYGDDNIVNVSDKIATVYNQQTVSETMKSEFGVTYTPGNKTGEFQTNMKITDLTFLKRSFRSERGKWLCPLEKKSFVYTAYWCKNSRLMKKIIIDDWENALQELSMHPKEDWWVLASKMAWRIHYHGSTLRFPFDREAYLDSVLRRTDEWY